MYNVIIKKNEQNTNGNDKSERLGKEMIKIGSHIGMNGKEMFLGSAKEAFSYGENTFMIYTGAPQNTRRKEISELKIEEGKAFIKEHGISDIVVHAPYIINLGNTVKTETFELAVRFLALELERTEAIGSELLVVHPGAHVGAGEDLGTAQIIKGINEVLTKDTKVKLVLETMAGKGSEIGKDFEQLKKIYNGVIYNDKLRICFDTCHTHDSGYDIIHNFDGVMEEFDKAVGKEQIAVFHINDSKNPQGAGKDRHENIGFGYIGFDALKYIVFHKDFENIPKILETPYIKSPVSEKKSYPPYQYEIEMLKRGVFLESLKQDIIMEMEREKE